MGESKFINAITHKCPSCGGGLDIDQGTKSIKCPFCGTSVQIVKPIKISEEDVNSELSAENKKKFISLSNIAEKSMMADNFREGYDYCNKMLEIDHQSAMAWENKAICSFWLSTNFKIIKQQANEIVTYLNTAKQLNENSETIPITSNNIAYNLYYIGYYHLYRTQSYSDSKYELFSGGYLASGIDDILSCIKLWGIAFQIHNDVLFLKEAVEQLTPTKTAKVKWKNDILKKQSDRFPIEKLRLAYIEKIKKIDPDYMPPSKPKCYVATATFNDYNHPVVVQLSDFRDNWLLEKKWGIKFVDKYYKYGLYFANFIEHSRLTRKISLFLIIRPLLSLTKIVYRNK